MADARTARELADEAQRVLEVLRQRYADDQGVDLAWETLSRRIAALASQAEPVAWTDEQRDSVRRQIMSRMNQLIPEWVGDWRGWPGTYAFAEAALIALADMSTPPAPAQAEPTLSDAIAAGDGTLHGAIDYWQQRASEDGRDAARWREVSDRFANTRTSRAERVLEGLGLEGDPTEPFEIAVDAAIAAKEQSRG